ncbi:Tti2p KNAG_0B06810 [Huiozyma naganishii CBS 8797]|uniref:Pre-rRNA-processing protein RIX1 n=1 Tax=Huiozyma naganishii (strain ATCC MYA-139 / BCRC 22969 / CBS 8797 / KCTC 17520 / NBRC 10181 / NCYC 3082 / Yp74L-3) TaxID=1071383 RepID=J7S5E9_HUIN7|nr:hypothetical protein KNAG_0B06810 [Kazachstania naganishii CBS 8797]CCK69106.1 hypothetical protein KNAG_0B06810 [Kazachstania naganishii CBS 8797]
MSSAISQFIEKVATSERSEDVSLCEIETAVNEVKRQGDEISRGTTIHLIQQLSCFALDQDAKKAQCVIKFVNTLWDATDGDPLYVDLIPLLKPHLLLNLGDGSSAKRRNRVAPGLNPVLGVSSQEDEIRSRWKSQGGWKHVGLFYIVLLHLQHRDVSVELRWITPGILNLLDDPHDIPLRVQGVQLVHAFVEVFRDPEHWVPFSSTGLFLLFEPVLKNMCYLVPTLYSTMDTTRVWRSVFPALIALYRVEFSDTLEYFRHLQSMCSEIVLRGLIPRLGVKYPTLTVQLLTTLSELLSKMGPLSVVLLQRTVYTLGECIVSDPFFTVADDIVTALLGCVETLVDVCPSERVAAHRYDLNALFRIIRHKCESEGATTEAIGKIVLGLEARIPLDT